MSTETKKNTYKKKVTLKNKKKLKPYEGGGEGEEEASIIKVLCWNIYWMAMEGYDRNELTDVEIDKGSRQPGRVDERKFGRYCADGKKISNTDLNICATNVKDLIDADTYDFVALQEASKWKNIYDKSENLKIKMGYVHYKLNNNNLVTFYDRTKYTLIAFKTGILSVKQEGDDKHNIRPYHILLLHDLSGNHYIFINLHAPHDITKDALESQLSNAMEDFYAISDETEKASISEKFIDIKSTAANIQNINTKFKEERNTYNKDIKITTMPYKMNWNAQNYNIIVAGDFNDTEGKFWSGLQPFKYSSITILKTLEVKLDKKPPPTCCSTNLENPEYTNIGDYILVNSSLKVEEIYTPHLTKPASDHLPIIIHIRPRSINSVHKEHVASHAVASPEPASPEPASREDCIPKIIHVFKVPGDGACLFSSLLHGLIRLKEQNVLSMDLKGAYNNDTDIPDYVRQNVQNFRIQLVNAIELYAINNEELIYSMRQSLSETPRILRNYELSPEEIIEISNNNIIIQMYVDDMKQYNSYGDETIITVLGYITNINVVIFDNYEDDPTIRIGGNCCYNGIWLHYNHVDHYDIIFPMNVNNSKYKHVVSSAPERFVVDKSKIKKIEHHNYKDIINITREDEVIIKQQPTPAPAPAQAQAKKPPATPKKPPAQAKKPPAPAKAPQAKAPPAKAPPASEPTTAPTKKPPEPGSETGAPAKAPPASASAPAPAPEPGSETGSETGAPAKAPPASAPESAPAPASASAPEPGSETGAPASAPAPAPEPGSAPEPTPEPGSETGAALAATLAATTLTPTPMGLAGRSRTRRIEQSHGEEQKSETPQLIEPISGNTQYDESNSGNMFLIPLIGVVLALSITFLVKK